MRTRPQRTLKPPIAGALHADSRNLARRAVGIFGKRYEHSLGTGEGTNAAGGALPA